MTPLCLDNGQITIYQGDCRSVLAGLPDQSVHCVITSPPYFGLRDYGLEPVVWGGDVECEHEWGEVLPPKPGPGNKPGEYSTSSLTNPDRQNSMDRPGDSGSFCLQCGSWRGSLGLEPSPDLFVQHIVEVFREVKRVLRGDGTLWLNLGDSYAAGGKGGGGSFMEERRDAAWQKQSKLNGWRSAPPGLKPKDLCGIPWRVAFALQADGWYLRSEIIWAKPNPMPESVTDRPTKAHEYIFLLSKSERYFYDHEAVKEPVTGNAHARGNGVNPKARWPSGWDSGEGNHHGLQDRYRPKQNESFSEAVTETVDSRNLRSVWEVATAPFPEAHFATFPPKLIEPCIKAGCPPGGTVLDPFGGAGTTGLVARRFHNKAILIEAKAEYCEMMARRLAQGALEFP